MRRVLAALLLTCALAGCGQGALISRSDALGKAGAEKGVSHLSRREAKLMTWPDFVRVSQVDAPPQAAPPGKQRVWLVAEAGDIALEGAHQHWVIFIYNAVTGNRIGALVGPFDQTTGEAQGPDWPSIWSQFPDSG
jgi:hypothetical protein